MAHYDASGFRIRYQAWGDPRDRAVLFFHGFPGSHIQAETLVPLLAAHKIFLIAADRPGYGGTVGSASREQYLDDLRSLLHQLTVQNFDVVGVSGGAPWAHLMASRFADSVSSLKIVCGLATYNEETQEYFSKLQSRGLRFRGFVPDFVMKLCLSFTLGAFKPEKKMERLFQVLSESDREIWRDPAIQSLLTMSMRQAREQGAKGIVFDAALYRRDWLREDCDPGKLEKIPTFYFRGLKDRVLDPRMSKWMHEANKGSRLRDFEEEGHFSLAFRHASEILEEK